MSCCPDIWLSLSSIKFSIILSYFHFLFPFSCMTIIFMAFPSLCFCLFIRPFSLFICSFTHSSVQVSSFSHVPKMALGIASRWSQFRWEMVVQKLLLCWGSVLCAPHTQEKEQRSWLGEVRKCFKDKVTFEWTLKRVRTLPDGPVWWRENILKEKGWAA